MEEGRGVGRFWSWGRGGDSNSPVSPPLRPPSSPLSLLAILFLAQSLSGPLCCFNFCLFVFCTILFLVFFPFLERCNHQRLCNFFSNSLPPFLCPLAFSFFLFGFMIYVLVCLDAIPHLECPCGFSEGFWSSCLLAIPLWRTATSATCKQAPALIVV